jgi:hypothetical protein
MSIPCRPANPFREGGKPSQTSEDGLPPSRKGCRARSQKGRRALALLPALLGMLLLLAACETTPREQALQATVEALSAENARLATAVAGGSDQPPVTSDQSAVSSEQSSAAATLPNPQSPITNNQSLIPDLPPLAPASADAVPRIVADLPLVSGDVTLHDFRADPDAGRIYVTDSAYVLHVIDTATYTVVQSIQTTGDLLTLDTANRRLYIAPQFATPADEGGSRVSIYDTAAGVLLDTTLPGARVAVDPAHNVLYVGEPVDASNLATAPGVRSVDGATLAVIVQSGQPGAPLFNPERDELVIVAYTAYTADPSTLDVRHDLFPEIGAADIIGCNGCQMVEDAAYFPDEGLLAFDVTTISAGKGAGVYPPPRLLDAEALTPVTAPWQVAASCSSRPGLRGPLDGRVYRHDFYSRYLVHNNLLVLDEAGNTLALRDGLGEPFVNPNTRTAYVDDGSAATFVLDLAALSPIATLEPLCIAVHDAGRSLLYAFARGEQDAAGDPADSPPWSRLVVLEETGGTADAPPPAPAPLEGGVRSILVSPNYGQDETIFVTAYAPAEQGEALYRSTDAGGAFVRLQGGLPAGYDLTLAAALSPDYAADRTLFAGGYRRDYAGVGVWRSEDGGDSWQPGWDGLEHLRVYRVEPSPRFAEDATLLAYSRYADVSAGQTGVSIARSTDGGLTWTRLMTASYENLLPAPLTWLPPDPERTGASELPVRKLDYADPFQYTTGAGRWITATAGLGANTYLRALLAAPGWPATPDIYAVTNAALLRTPDGGATWQRWDDPRMAGRSSENEVTAAAITPRLPDGGYRLVVGTANGELWVLDPAQLQWTAVFSDQLSVTSEQLEVTGGGTPTATVAVTATTAMTAAAPAAEPAATPAPVATATLAAPTEAAPTEAASTVTAAPTPTVAATAPITTAQSPITDTESPPPGLFAPVGEFAMRWQQDDALRAELGWATAQTPSQIAAAYQYFEHGRMLWRGDDQRIYVLLEDNTWQSYEDTYREGEPERDPNLFTPGELLQPIRGFGKLWRTTEGLRDRIGWAVAEEEGVSAFVQPFERGALIRQEGNVYVLLDDGRWHF